MHVKFFVRDKSTSDVKLIFTNEADTLMRVGDIVEFDHELLDIDEDKFLFPGDISLHSQQEIKEMIHLNSFGKASANVINVVHQFNKVFPDAVYKEYYIELKFLILHQ